VDLPLDGWPYGRIASVGGTLAVLRDDQLELRDGLTGDLLRTVHVPYAVGVMADERQFWLDEGSKARSVSPQGDERALVGMPGGVGLLAASPRWVATRRSGAFDYMAVAVIKTTGKQGRVMATPTLTNVGTVTFADSQVVVASDQGLRCYSLGTKAQVPLERPPHLPAEGSHGHLISGLRAAPGGWVEWWDERHSEPERVIGPSRGPFTQVEGSWPARSATWAVEKPRSCA
jgi:hypothetical protein